MEPFQAFLPEDLEVVKRYAKLSVNLKRLLSQIFTEIAIDFKILILKAQELAPYLGWHFKFKDHRCWYGVSFAPDNFMAVRFLVEKQPNRPNLQEQLKAQGFGEVKWADREWMMIERPTDAISAMDRDKQVATFTAAAREYLLALEKMEVLPLLSP